MRQIIHAQRQRDYASSFQIVKHSIQKNHLHLIIEAADGPTPAPKSRCKNPLRTGISGFAIAFAKRLNKLLGRTGAVFADRYHAHELVTPLEVRRAIRYVLQNYRKHNETGVPAGYVDPYASGGLFDGWASRPRLVFDPYMLIPVFPRTWLLAVGWRRHGLIDVREVPGCRELAPELEAMAS